MKQLFLLFTCALSSLSQAQTAIIAHKSHSGMASTFVIDPSGNFGIPPSRLTQVIRLNDTASIKVYGRWSDGSFDYCDTVYHNPYYSNYQLNIDSMNRYPFYHVDYINFKHSPDSLKPRIPGYQQPVKINAGEPQKNLEMTPSVPEKTPKKKKKSYLLFLFGITGGGMLLTRLFSRKRIPQQSIA